MELEVFWSLAVQQSRLNGKWLINTENSYRNLQCNLGQSLTRYIIHYPKITSHVEQMKVVTIHNSRQSTMRC